MPETDQNKPRWSAELALLVVCLIWGCNFAVMKSVFDELHPFAFNAVRLTLSTVVLGIWHHVKQKRLPPLPPGTWWKILGLSLIGYFAYQVVFLLGLKRTPSGNSALIISSAPIFTAMLGLFLGERLRRGAWIGLLIAFGGAIVIALQKGVELESGLLVGNLLSLAAAATWGSFTALNRGVAQLIPGASLAYYTTLITLPLHWLIALPHLDPFIELTVTSDAWLAIAFSGLFGTGLAYAFWNLGIERMGASHTAGFVNIVPVIALFVGWAGLGEPVSWIQIGGGLFVLGGVWVMRMARGERR